MPEASVATGAVAGPMGLWGLTSGPAGSSELTWHHAVGSGTESGTWASCRFTREVSRESAARRATL